MFQFRVVDNGMHQRPDFQFRYHLFTTDASGGLCPADPENKWSEWKDAQWVKASEIDDD